MEKKIVSITIDVIMNETELFGFMTNFENQIDEVTLLNANNERKTLFVENTEIEVEYI